MAEQPITHNPSLSGDAALLLSYLERFAPRPDLAKADRVIAAALGKGERSIIDLADELLQAGHVVVARTVFPMGRWLLLPNAGPDLWQQARDYVAGLDARAISIHARAKHARQALERMEASRPTDSRGQQRMFAQDASRPGVDPKAWAGR